MANSPDCYPFRSIEARDRYLTHYDTWSKSWPVPSEARTLRTSYGETFVRVSGAVDEPPLVLLPGGRAPSLCWMPMIKTLSAGFRTYALDAIYDVGRSISAKPVLKPEDVTDWLDEVIEELAPAGSVNIMGLSLGGWATAEYTLRHPERIAKTVWLSPAGVVAPISPGFIGHGVISMLPGTWSLRSFLNWIMPDAARGSGQAREFFECIFKDLVVSSACFKARPFPGGPRPFSEDELRQIRVPVLYVVGDRERVCKNIGAAVSRAGELVPGIEVEVLPGSGHDVSVLHPVAVANRVVEFLKADETRQSVAAT